MGDDAHRMRLPWRGLAAATSLAALAAPLFISSLKAMATELSSVLNETPCAFGEPANPAVGQHFADVYCAARPAFTGDLQTQRPVLLDGKPALLQRHYLRREDPLPAYQLLYEERAGQLELRSLHSLVDGIVVFADEAGKMLCWLPDPAHVLPQYKPQAPKNLPSCRAPQPAAVKQYA